LNEDCGKSIVEKGKMKGRDRMKQVGEGGKGGGGGGEEKRKRNKEKVGKG